MSYTDKDISRLYQRRLYREAAYDRMQRWGWSERRIRFALSRIKYFE